MAKKRKHKHSHRRRIGAVAMSAKSPLVTYGSIAAGYALSNQVNNLLDKVTGGKIDSKIVNGILTVGGLYFAFMSKAPKTLITALLAGVAAGTGVKGLLKDFGVISGFRSIPVISGYGRVPVIAGGYKVPAQSVMGAVRHDEGDGRLRADE
jgi:hypothetical protein